MAQIPAGCTYYARPYLSIRKQPEPVRRFLRAAVAATFGLRITLTLAAGRPGRPPDLKKGFGRNKRNFFLLKSNRADTDPGQSHIGFVCDSEIKSRVLCSH